jgi:hypothetical protein
VALALVSLVVMATPYRLPKEERPTTKQPKNRLLSLVVLPEGATRMLLVPILIWLFFSAQSVSLAVFRSFRNQNSNWEPFFSLPWGFVCFIS